MHTRAGEGYTKSKHALSLYTHTHAYWLAATAAIEWKIDTTKAILISVVQTLDKIWQKFIYDKIDCAITAGVWITTKAIAFINGQLEVILIIFNDKIKLGSSFLWYWLLTMNECGESAGPFRQQSFNVKIRWKFWNIRIAIISNRGALTSTVHAFR